MHLYRQIENVNVEISAAAEVVEYIHVLGEFFFFFFVANFYGELKLIFVWVCFQYYFSGIHNPWSSFDDRSTHWRIENNRIASKGLQVLLVNFIAKLPKHIIIVCESLQ